MHKPERGSLNILRKALPDVPAPDNPELEKHLLGDGSEESSHGPDVQQAVQQVVKPDVQQPFKQPAIELNLDNLRRIRREPTRTVTFRLPDSLHAELIRKARYNDFSQTDIMIEALRFYLSHLQGPKSEE